MIFRQGIAQLLDGSHHKGRLRPRHQETIYNRSLGHERVPFNYECNYKTHPTKNNLKA